MLDTKPLVRIEGLRVEFQTHDGPVTGVEDLSFDIRPGECLCVVGESGSGKSVSSLSLMRLVEFGGGEIANGRLLFQRERDEIDLAKAPPAAMRDIRGNEIAMIFQEPMTALNPVFTVGEQLAEGLIVHRGLTRAQARARALELLHEVRIPEPERRLRQYPHELSGGMRQRVVIAMAMACRPRLLICDEPTTALDVTTQIEVLAAIREVVRRHDAAAIYITHDLAVVAQMADRIKVLLKGEEVEEAPTREMLAAPREDYTRSLWAVRNFQPAPRDEPAAPEPILSIVGVSASYGVHPVLRDVSISVPRGRTVAVVGESGSGKSTTARVVMGLLPPSAGQVVFDGQVLDPLSRNRPRTLQRRLQMIHQMADTALNPRHRVREILGRPLEFFLGLRGRKKEDRIRDLLDQIELEPDRFIDRLPGELSGGQKQRLCIARALAAEPELIICDEVTSALDQLVAEGILRLLDRLQREMGLSYLFITHDLATVRSIADEVVVMQNGAVVEQGPKAQMFQPPHHPYTEKLLSSVPEMDPDWLTRLLGQRQMQEKGAA